MAYKAVVLFLLLFASFDSILGRAGTRRWNKLENLVQERPAKPSKGLLEKPMFSENRESEESDEVDHTTQPSWISRSWKNPFGRSDPFSEVEDQSQEPEEFEGFFTTLKPWWKGPNVCQSESQHIEPQAENDGSFFTFLMTTCHDSGRSYKCIKKTRQNSTAAKIHTLTYQCCLGYDRDPRSRLGCPKQIELQDLPNTLRNVNATKLAGALEGANLTTLINNGEVTLFAPSDNAMTSNDGQNDINVVVLETADKMQFARDILQSHIATGTRVYSSDDFQDEMLLSTASNGATIRINIFARPTPFATANCARIVSSDHRTQNGSYIHVIDRVLTPVKRNLWQMIEDDPRFSAMRSLIDENIRRQLVDPKQHMTLLAFSDEAFEKLSPDMRQRIRNKDSCFNNLLLHHVLPHTICAAAIYDDRGYVRNLASRIMNATRSSEGVIRFANRKVLTADQMATNGVMQIIDGVILVPEMLDTIGALEYSNGPAAQFASALKSRELAPSLSESDQPVTVFVPPSENISGMSINDLRNHIVRQSILDRFRVVLNRPKTVVTEAGRNVTIRFDYDYAGLFDWNAENRLRLYVGCSRAERIISSCNGAIVVLDKPLVTPTTDTYELLKSKPELSEFVSLIDRAGLKDTLKGNRLDATILAPSNDALATSLTGSEKRRLTTNQSHLRRFLKEHFILGAKCCNELSGNDWFLPGRYTTMAGTKVTSIGNSAVSTLKVGGADVDQCDLMATNGIVHVVDSTVSSRRRSSVWSSHWDQFEDEFFDE